MGNLRAVDSLGNVLARPVEAASPADGPTLPTAGAVAVDAYQRISGGEAVQAPGSAATPEVDPAALWASLRAAPSSRLEDVAAVLTAAGFVPRDDDTWACGPWSVQLVERCLPRLDATEVRLRGPVAGAAHEARLQDETRVLVGKALIAPELYGAVVREFERVQAQLRRAIAAVGADPTKLPRDFETLKEFLITGFPPAERERFERERTERRAARQQIVDRFAQLREEGRAPTRLLIYLEGADGVGKTSSASLILKALEKAGFTPQVFGHKAPTAEESAHGEFWRFRQHLPQAPGIVCVHDRGPLGGPTYVDYSPEQLRAFDEGLAAYDRDLSTTEGLFAFKLFIRSSEDAQAGTHGKRLGRLWAVDQLLPMLREAGLLTPEVEAALWKVDDKFNVTDFEALETYQTRQRRFDRSLAVDTPLSWCDVDSSDRHVARMGALTGFQEQLEAWAAA